MNDIERFCDWYLQHVHPFSCVPLHGAVRRIEDVLGVKLWTQHYNEGAPEHFQVQMFVVPPNYVIPEHTHPNVDSIEVYVGGQIRFSHSGRFVVSEDEFNKAGENGMPTLRGRRIRVRPNDVHGGVFGPAGGVFLSVQNWLNGVRPECVSTDYDGIAMGRAHAETIRGKAILLDRLDARSAASKEYAT